jgi:DNA-binding transcriptional regulator/RsmH inhibitor MraZ
MSFVLPNFIGFQEHKMDSKFRVSIPVAWRPQEGEQLILQEADRYGHKYIRVLTLDAFAQIEQEISETQGVDNGDIREAIEVLYDGILAVTVNNQGKLLIPKDWSLRADIAAESNVILAGRGRYFDIFNTDSYAKIKTAQKANVNEKFSKSKIF